MFWTIFFAVIAAIVVIPVLFWIGCFIVGLCLRGVFEFSCFWDKNKNAIIGWSLLFTLILFCNLIEKICK
jgi:hypothetical protein